MAASFHFNDLVFDPVSRIEPERDSSGAVRDFTPHVRLESQPKPELLQGGEGPFCKFSISNRWRGKPGVYLFLVDGVLVYVGECECLVKRINQGYGCIAPRNCFDGGQATNVRINSLIRKAVLQARTVELAFCLTDDRKRVESEMISALTPRWNRGRPRSVASVKIPRTTATPPIHRSAPDRMPDCRELILKAVRDLVSEKGRNEFTVLEIIKRLHGADYSESTIRTHITSRCCLNAPKNHAVTYGDFERIARGLYRLV
jgi:hypothetical protein